MKKLLLSGAATLLAAVSFAQNVVTTTQNGTSQTATATQTGTGLTAILSQVGTPATNASNSAETIQQGVGHSATVNQNTGSNFNRAGITQINATDATSGNTATISQSNGAGGSSLQTGVPGSAVGTEGNWVGVAQVGSGNTATITVDGTGTKANFAETWQKGTTNAATTTQSGGASLNQAMIYQGDETGPAVGPTNIEVTGNTVLVNQNSGTNNKSMVKQFSNGNTVTVDQVGDPNNLNSVSGNTSFVQQGETGAAAAVAGNNTTNIQQQGGISQGNSATALQNGTSSTAQVIQVNTSSNNVGFIQQISGVGSDARIRQIGNSQGNKGTIIETGNFQGGLIEQGGSSTNEATIMQGVADFVSNNNRAYVSQLSGAVSNSATIKQNQTSAGERNLAFVDQSGVTTLNVAAITQENSNNRAGLTQTGTGSNTATFTQTGNNNVIGGPGAGNAFTGVANSAVQDGMGNTMTVTQTSTGAMASMSLNNMANLNQTGDMNTINLSQTLTGGATAGNMSTINQNGNGNAATVTQTNGMTVMQ